MKYLIHITSGISKSIDEGNFRGEPRWERSVLAALLASGSEVHTTKSIWQNPDTRPVNLHDGLNPEWQSDSVLITHGIKRNPHITTHAKYYMVQYHEPPDEEHKHLFLKYQQERPGCILATTATFDKSITDNLQNILGQGLVECIEGPAVPCVYPTDNWRKSYLL